MYLHICEPLEVKMKIAKQNSFQKERINTFTLNTYLLRVVMQYAVVGIRITRC